MIKVVYIATDLIKTDEGYCFNVVTELKVADRDVQYIASHVFEHYDDARDYVVNIDCAQSEIKTEHNAVKISSRFSPEILHDGWAEF